MNLDWKVEEVQDLLVRCWMTHDGMWFYHCFSEFGAAKASELNLRAIESLSHFEVRRVCRAVGLDSVRTLADFDLFWRAAEDLVLADFMGGDMTRPEPGIMRVDWKKCFAYEGLTRIGAIEDYRCGVYHRLEEWFRRLELDFEARPAFERCQMLETGRCRREYRFKFPEG